MEEEVEKVPASETGMTKLGASKRKRTSSGDAERGKLVLEVVEPAVEEPEEKASQIFTHVQGNPNPVISFGERESAVYYDCPPAAHSTASAQFLNVPEQDPSTS